MILINLGVEDIQKAGLGRFQRLRVQATVWAADILSNFSDRTQNIVILSVAVSVGLLFPLVFYQNERFYYSRHQKKMAIFQAELDKVQVEILKLSGFKAELDSYEKQKKLIMDRIAAVRGLLSTRSAPLQVLDTVGQSLPGKTWLTKVDLQVSGELATLNATGISYSSEEISDFVDKLTDSVFFSDVNMGEVNNSRIEERVNGKAFSLSAKAKVRNLSSTQQPTLKP